MLPGCTGPSLRGAKTWERFICPRHAAAKRYCLRIIVKYQLSVELTPLHRLNDAYVIYLEGAGLSPDEETVQVDGRPKVSLCVVPRAIGTPEPTKGWQIFLGFVLALLTLGTTVRLLPDTRLLLQ